ncbi:helix-turn-helix domain-containing protein [Nevskia ramosa]|uniref:helix-turn-helix domain-containing protein n=1 Tax=Nevskia ramosa TaxID=64002 RepID=UPI00235663E5|nr:XRE family transcriptional regulator [Nevskia ramosa]
MKTISAEEIGTGLSFTDDAFEAGFDPAEAALLRTRAEMLRALRNIINTWPGTQTEKAVRLKIKQPRLALILNAEAESQFSLDHLVKLAGRAGMAPSISLAAAA